MTITVYRITKLRYQDRIFSGLGGLYAHGRWTSRGRPVIYTSASISLAVLEYTVNYRNRGWVPASVLGRASIPNDVPIDVVKSGELPRGWSDADPPSTLRSIGEKWLESGTTAILKAPSAIVTEEWNYLLNPQHPDFKKLVFGKPKRYRLDYRLARTRKN